MVLGSSPVAVTSPSDFAPASSMELLDIQATIECGFTHKRVRDMTRTYSYISSVLERFGTALQQNQTHPSCNTFFNQKRGKKDSLKRVYRETTHTFFCATFCLKFFFFIPQKPFKIAQKNHPWKTITQSQAKPKLSFL